MSNAPLVETDTEALSSGALIDRIREQHDLHLRAVIPFVPSIAARLAREYGEREPRLVEVRDLTIELRRLLEAHLDDEEDELFPAIRAEVAPTADDLRAAGAEHREIDAAFDRLRLLSVGCNATPWACGCYGTFLGWLNALEAHFAEDVRLEERMLRDLARPVQGASSEVPMIDPQQSVAGLVLEHSECAAVLQRHRIDYCCHGEVSLSAACRDRGLDVGEVIDELERAISDRDSRDEDPRSLSSRALISHIVLRYHAPLRNTLPSVRTLAAKVARVHGQHNPRLIELNETVTELAETLAAHIDDEELRLFPALAGGDPGHLEAGAMAKSMREEHAALGTLLHRLRAHSEDYAVPDWACTSYRTLFRELDRLETDVLRHVHLENHVLLPRFEVRAHVEGVAGNHAPGAGA